MVSDVSRAADTFAVPYLLNENLSFLVMRSSPKNILIMLFLAKATGMSEEALMPMSPSDSQSTASPLPNAMNMQTTVLIVSGMHSIIAGSMDRVMYGPRGEKLHNMIWHISRREYRIPKFWFILIACPPVPLSLPCPDSPRQSHSAALRNPRID